MRKVIEKKAYDTDTARLIVVLPCPHARHDFKWNETRVYQSPRGAYFLAGKGGASSRWAKATPRGSIAGAGIEVIAKDEALAYAKYAGLSPNRFARCGFEREEGYWHIDDQQIHVDHVIGRTI